ncbi:MAG: hypothetical protein H7249_17755 [Chitinophagaceae bacterium]|nr:hypothetical protein [Oligoflexus sp.]
MKTIIPLKNKSESGSSAMALIVGVAVLGSSGLYVKNLVSSTSRLISERKVNADSEMQQTNSISSASRFKSLLTPSMNPAKNLMVPPLYPKNYFNTAWELSNADGKSLDGVGMTGIAQVSIDSYNTDTLSLNEIAPIMKGDSTFNSLSKMKMSLQIVKLNPLGGSPANPMIDSVDVKIQSGAERNHPAYVNIKLVPPIPRVPKLALRLEGSSALSFDFTNVPNGNHEICILGSGVVFAGRITIDSLSQKVGGWDPATGLISHNAVSYDSVDSVIGCVKKHFGGGPSVGGSVDATACKWIPDAASGSSTYKINGEIIGVKSSDTVAATEVVMNVQGAPASFAGNLTDLYQNQCLDKCPYFGPNTLGSWTDSDYELPVQAQAFGSSTNAEFMTTKHQQFNLPDNKKLCFNFSEPLKAFQAVNPGKYPATRNEMMGPPFNTWDQIGLYTYDAGTCQERFLFTRNGCGCFNENTLILLGDGITQKSIKDLTYNDTIWNPSHHRAYSIRKISVGPEKVPMFHIQADGHDLTVTGTHPFITPQGIEAAFELEQGQLISMDSGTFAPISVIEIIPVPSSPPDVWNVEVNAADDDLGAHQVVANGIVTGDLYIQTLKQAEQ